LCKERSCDLLLTHGVRECEDETEALNGGIEFVATRSVRGRQEPVRLYTVRAHRRHFRSWHITSISGSVVMAAIEG
jgi:hypothetical protein